MRRPKEIVVDERRRTSLAKVGRKDDTRYLVEEFEDGSLLLVPAFTISALELAVLRNPRLRESLERAQPGRERPPLRPRRSTEVKSDTESAAT